MSEADILPARKEDMKCLYISLPEYPVISVLC